MKSSRGITATGPLAEEIGPGAENEEAVQKLLKGRILPEEYAKHYPNFREEAREMINSMQNDKRSTKRQWKFGIEEYKDLFSKTREDTTCGPSGLHMSHWKAALEDVEIINVHASMTWAAFALGYSYDRWNISYHSMLQKLQKPYITKLRIIQIFEGDTNGGFKYLFGRVLMKKLVEDGIIDPNAYGGIPGRDPLEAMKVLQYMYDNHRLQKRDLIVIFNDAAGCFDRVRPNQAEICSRRVGCPPSLSKTHTKLQQNMRHYIKTSAGVSTGTIQYKNTLNQHEHTITENNNTTTRAGNIGGVGQGGGASPIEWLVVLLAMLNAFKVFSEGAKLIDPNSKYGGKIPVVSFVDDNSITMTPRPQSTTREIFAAAAKEMEHWKNCYKPQEET